MSTPSSASLLARLLALAKQRGDDYSLLLNRFALERLLFRLGVSAHADRFLLKGALLFAVWYEAPHRPTRDADLLGFGPDGEEHLLRVFRDIAAIDAGDGIVFDTGSLRADAIREHTHYGGTRLHLRAQIGTARCALQIDVGFGDAVTPGPQAIDYPCLLQDFAPPALRAYPVYTVVAEKYQAMVALGQANTRMKDFYDLATIAQRTPLDGATLSTAIAATFARRATALPATPPLALTPTFGEDAAKARQWKAFVAKNGLPPSDDLADTIALLAALLWPATERARRGEAGPWQWSGGRWQAGEARG